MHIVPNAKCQQMFVRALWLVFVCSEINLHAITVCDNEPVVLYFMLVCKQEVNLHNAVY